MKNRAIPFTAILLIISLGSYFSIISDGSIRAVEFVSLLACGALMGVLLTQIIGSLKDKKRAL